jgi:hypothetical protein
VLETNPESEQAHHTVTSGTARMQLLAREDHTSHSYYRSTFGWEDWALVHGASVPDLLGLFSFVAFA